MRKSACLGREESGGKDKLPEGERTDTDEHSGNSTGKSNAGKGPSVEKFPQTAPGQNAPGNSTVSVDKGETREKVGEKIGVSGADRRTRRSVAYERRLATEPQLKTSGSLLAKNRNLPNREAPEHLILYSPAQ